MVDKVKVFKVVGQMRLSNGEARKFSIEVTALKRDHALEKVYSWLGSRHKVSRSHIKILEIKEISFEETKNEYIRSLLSMDKIVVFP